MEVGVIMPAWKEISSEQDLGPVKRTLGGALSNIVDTGQSLLGTLVKLANPATAFMENHPIDYIPSITKSAKKTFGVTDEQLAPQGLIESGAQRFLSQAPFVAAGGIGGGLRGIASDLGRTALGATAATAAKGLGAPEIVQDITQAATEVGAPILREKLSSLKRGLKFESPLTKHKASLYEQARKDLAPGSRGSIKALKPALDEIQKFNQFETSSKVRTVVNDAVESIYNNIEYPHGRIDIGNAWESIKSLGKQIKDHKTPDGARQYLSKLQHGLKGVLEDYKPYNEAFWKNRTDANAIHTAQKMSSVIGDFAKNNLSSKGSYVKKVLIPLNLVAKGLSKAEIAYDYIKTEPIRRWLGKTFEAAVKDNPGNFAKYALKLDKAIDTSGIKQKEQEVPEQKTRWKEIT